MAKKQPAFDLYALDPKAKRAIKAEDSFKADLKTKNKFAARPQTGATASAPRRGGIERTADRLAAFGVPLSVTDAIKAVDRNLLGLDETAQSIRNIQSGDAGAGDYLNVALSAPVLGGAIAKPLEVAAGKLGRGALNVGRRALDTRAGRYLTEAMPVLDNADDAIEAAFRVVPGAPSAPRRLTDQRPRVQGLPKPFVVPVTPADVTDERTLPTLNVSDRNSQIQDYAPYTEMVPIAWLDQLEGNDLRYGGDKLRALAEDIATRGVANPLIVSVGKKNSSAILGEGNHRLAAARMAGLTHMPVRVSVGDEVGSTFAGRSDLVPTPGKYFPSQARPSEVFSSLQEGGDIGASYLKLRGPKPLDPELQALLDEVTLQELLKEYARGGRALAVKPCSCDKSLAAR